MSSQKYKISFTSVSDFSHYNLSMVVQDYLNQGWELSQPIMAIDAGDGINGPFFVAFLRTTELVKK